MKSSPLTFAAVPGSPYAAELQRGSPELRFFDPQVEAEYVRADLMHSRTLMEWVLRIMANLLRPDELGPAEAAYRAVAAIARIAPEP